MDDIDSLDIHLLKGMLDTMTDHVFILRAEGNRYKLVYCNQAMDCFMNRTEFPLRGRYLDDIVPNAELYRRITDNYARAISENRVIRYEETTEGFEPAPLTVFETSLSPLKGSDGTIYICGISRNITQRRDAEKELQRSHEKLAQQLAENQRLQEQLRQEAIRDPLTDLFNRRYFMESLARELSRADREEFEVTLMMVDIDHFKTLNDRHGHQTGDRVLTEFSQALLDGMRKEDVVCRWGGEEFLIMMPGLSLEDARHRITEWRRRFSPMTVSVDGQDHLIRFSAGLATAPLHGFSPDAIINATDQALYQAKEQGRDRLCLYDVSEPAE